MLSMTTISNLTDVPYGLVLNRVSFPITLTDRDNRFVFVNEAFVHRYGFLSRDLLGLTPRLLVPRHSPKRMLAGFEEQVLRQFRRWEGEVLNRRRDNEIFRVYLSVFPLRLNEQADPIAFLGITCDPEQRAEMLSEVVSVLADQWFHGALQRALPTLSATLGATAPRQSAIQKLCRMGFSTKEIAHIMGVSPSTVGVVRWRLRSKPGGGGKSPRKAAA
jgi:PAS domain S-box-containing protein